MTVSQRSTKFSSMSAATKKGRDLMGGTEVMRKAGQLYAPKFPQESEEDHKARLANTSLFNGYRKTLTDTVGRVFRKPAQLITDSEVMKSVEANIDMQGRDLSQFSAAVLLDGLQSGINFLFVDSPRREGAVSKAEAKSRNLRPYITLLTVDDIISVTDETIGNVQTVTQVRIAETVTKKAELDEFDIEEIEQVRVLDLIDGKVQVRLYQDDKQVDEPYFINVPIIPIVPFYASRTGFWSGEPVYDDLADVNLQHWRLKSDYDNTLHHALAPMKFFRGFSESPQAVEGAGLAYWNQDPSSAIDVIEHKGSAIGSGREALKDLEQYMQVLGLQLLVQKSGNNTATGDRIDDQKSQSKLSSVADNLQDALEQAFVIAKMYAGESIEVNVQINKEFTELTTDDLDALIKLRVTGNLTQETLLTEVKRRGGLSEDVDVQKEVKATEAEHDLIEPNNGD